MKNSTIILICFTFACSETDFQTSDGEVRFESTADIANDDRNDFDRHDFGYAKDAKDQDLRDASKSDFGGALDMMAMDQAADINSADMVDDVSPEDMGPAIVEPPTAPVTLTPTYFHADANAPIGVRAWATTSYPIAMPDNVRSTIFWGRFRNDECAVPGYASLIEHPLSMTGMTVFRAFYPECNNLYGPSVDAKVYAFGKTQHLLRSELRPQGPFQSFGNAGQNASGANKFIQAVYTEFNPSWLTANRMRPWGGPSVDPTKIRVAIRAKESVTRDLIEAPATQQLQQVIRILVINEACDPQQSSSFCQLEFNFKTYNRGTSAYTSFTKGDVFNDSAQGGLIAVVGPIAGTGASTTIEGTSAWTSWGSSTQLQPFQDKTFQVEISWNQFQALLRNVTNNNPSTVFGNQWNNKQAWILLRVGYGQENYNRSANASSLVEGLFESIEILAL